MPLFEMSTEEILPMAMLRRQQAQTEPRPATPLERAYDLLAEDRPLLPSRWTTPARVPLPREPRGSGPHLPPRSASTQPLAERPARRQRSHSAHSAPDAPDAL